MDIVVSTQSTLDELLTFFKALSEGNRLRILGLLSQEAYSVEQLAALLELRPSTVSHHLSRLAKAGLVSARADGYYSVYQLEREVLQGMADRLMSERTLLEAAQDVDLEAYDRRVLAEFLQPDGSLKTLPAPDRKLHVVLRHLAQAFKPGLSYTEREVNDRLAVFHADTASLRRGLLEAGLLDQQEGRYWRVEA